jgi:hypothetical protein
MWQQQQQQQQQQEEEPAFLLWLCQICCFIAQKLGCWSLIITVQNSAGFICFSCQIETHFNAAKDWMKHSSVSGAPQIHCVHVCPVWGFKNWETKLLLKMLCQSNETCTSHSSCKECFVVMDAALCWLSQHTSWAGVVSTPALLADAENKCSQKHSCHTQLKQNNYTESLSSEKQLEQEKLLLVTS